METAVQPDLQVLGDEALLTRILSNYLDNALKFTRSRIGVRLESREGGVRLSVTDDGNGLPPEELEKSGTGCIRRTRPGTRSRTWAWGWASPLWLRRPG